MLDIQQIRDAIQPLDTERMREAQVRLDSLTKPPGSLGRLEKIARQIVGITGELFPDLSRKAVIIMAADHGVCEEGVSAYPQAVTAQMVLNFLNGGAAVNVVARHVGAEIVCVDIGGKAPIQHPGLISHKIRHGTGNAARGPAMQEQEAWQAIRTGLDAVQSLVRQGYRLFATGEMGIGNTTPSSAILSVLEGVDVEAAVGRGTGIDDRQLRLKKQVVRRMIEVNRPDPQNPFDVLCKIGGLEIAGLVGVILGAAANRCPVVIDGFISSAAALLAARLAPRSVEYMIPSHLSGEQGHRLMLEAIGVEPMLQMDMRLGEGTGAALCFPIIDAALKLMREMATFESAGISKVE